MTVKFPQIDAPARGFGAAPLAKTQAAARPAEGWPWGRRLRSVLGRMGPQWGLIVLAVLAADVAIAALAWGLVRLATG